MARRKQKETADDSVAQQPKKTADDPIALQPAPRPKRPNWLMDVRNFMVILGATLLGAAIFSLFNLYNTVTTLEARIDSLEEDVTTLTAGRVSLPAVQNAINGNTTEISNLRLQVGQSSTTVAKLEAIDTERRGGSLLIEAQRLQNLGDRLSAIEGFLDAREGTRDLKLGPKADGS